MTCAMSAVRFPRLRAMLVSLAWTVIVVLFASHAPAAIASERTLLLPGDASPKAKTAGLSGLRAAAKTSGKVKVIVGLRVPFAAEGRLRPETVRSQRREIATAVSTVKARFQKAVQRNPKAFRSFNSIPFVVMEVTQEELDRLASDVNVISVSENQLLKPFLAESSPLVGADKAWQAGFSGLGQTIAIIDTGVDKNHPFLAGKVVSEACYSQNGGCPGGVTVSTAAGSGMPCTHSDCYHGTHVAGIAAGLGSGFFGVARNASLIAIQVFSNVNGDLGAYDADLLAALDRVYALRNDFKIAAVNLSLGGEAYSSVCDTAKPAYQAAINNLASAGIATIAASGNSYYTSAISAPACISTAVSVGAVSDAAWGTCNGQSALADKVACYSNSASYLSLLAPGSLIRSSAPNNVFMNLHGTSMATPHVAGAWAVIRQKAPNASIAQILAALQSTGQPVTDYRNGIVKKRINVKAALDSFADPDEKFALQYNRLEAGGGTVSFAPAGTFAACTDSCSNSFSKGVSVVLTAVASENASFTGWSGACTGTGTCTVVMSQALTVSASFTLKPAETANLPQALQFTKQGAGNGVVSFTPAGTQQSCAASCANEYPTGTAVTLTAAAAQGSIFEGWSGACSGPGSCTLTMAQAAAVSASFAVKGPDPAPAPVAPTVALEYTRLGPGQGSVSFSPAGTLAACSESCSNSYPSGASVTVTAAASPGSAFLEWSGACRGTGVCQIAMSQSQPVSARFIAASDKVLSYTKLGAGSGNVSFSSPAGVTACGDSCLNSHPANARVTLRAQPVYGSAFAGWSGACKNRTRSCVVRMRDAVSVTARFEILPLHAINIALAGSGSGSVTITAPDGAKLCTSNCSESFPSGTRVKLTPNASPGMAFAGWGGACKNARNACNVTMGSVRSVTARFKPL
ncbi:MAG: S8 family peptidase [Aestuariivirga sp.]|uniref:S8 family peptidase n=1 Tax=Aestuariivirga sp. TaxID=2650926 RepID=UPI0038D0E50F